MQVMATGIPIHGNANYAATAQKAEGESFAQELKLAKNRLQTATRDMQTTDANGEEDAAKRAAEDQKLHDACKGFEAMFLNIMYSKMRDTVPKDELFGHSNADDILQSMRDTEMMNQAANAGGIGLGDMLYQQLKRDQAAMVVSPAKAK